MKKTFYVLVFAVLVARASVAAKLFAIEATYGGGTTLKVENASLPNLVNDLVKQSGSFSALSGEAVYSGSLTYFALPNALKIDLDRTNPQLLTIRLTSDLTGLDQTFEATNEDDLQKQLARWFYLDGSDAAAALLSAAIQASAGVITDGSPGATTAQMTDVTYRMFGLYSGATGTNGMRGAESGAHFAIWYDGDNFTIDSPIGELEGKRSRVTMPLWLHFNKRVSLVSLLEMEFIDIEDTEFYGLGGDIGFALRPVVREGADRFGWQITPFMGAYGVVSVDGVTAAIVSQYGAVNRFEWRVFNRSLFAFVSQYTTFDNVRIDMGDVELSTPIDQDILKNGLLYEFPLTSKRLYGNVQFTDTRFLQESRVDNFQNYGVGLSYRLKRFSMKGTLGYDHSDLYSGAMWNLGAVWDL